MVTITVYKDFDNEAGYEIKLFEWNDIEKYLEQIIDMQLENTYEFHYPQKNPDRKYVKNKILEIKKHLTNKNTYFIGAITVEKVYGYIWCYESIFIDEKRMNINSLFVCREARESGLGKQLVNRAKEIALNNNCNAMATHYAVFNESAGLFYLNNGFKPARIEMICNLNNCYGE